jgi:putative chitinase
LVGAVITAEQVRLIAGPVCPPERAEALTPHLSAMLSLADCSTVTRAAAMLAQVVWETGQLRYLVEPESDATAAYGGGSAYRGRGFVHLTHRANYVMYGDLIAEPLVDEPDLAAEPDVAAKVAASYWRVNHLSELADARDFRGITEKINGRATEGPPSYHERREKHYRTALEVLGMAATLG